MNIRLIIVIYFLLIPTSLFAWIADLGEPYPVFTPDGKKIIYTFDGSHGYFETYSVLINSVYENGYAWRNLTRHEYGSSDEWYRKLADLTLSSDGKTISYVMEFHDSYSELFVADVNGFDEYVLESGESIISSPAFSPDGSKVVYMSTGGGNTSLCIKDINGMNKYVLAEAIDAGLAFAEDGERIIFGAERKDRVGIFEINPDGTGEKLLSELTANPVKIVMSPDGEKLAVVAVSDYGDSDIYVLNVDGTGLTELVGEGTDDFDPVFTPDGEKVVYVSAARYEIDDYEDLPPDKLYIVNIDGSGAKRITDNEHGELHPAISPDGTKICYLGYNICWSTECARKEHELHIMNLDGSEERVIVPFGFQEI